MSRVELSKIRSLTFYKDELTTARRTAPLSQLNCLGKPCRFFQPEAIRCINTGGEGTNIDWKCEADLPEALRFGKVEVNCEGFSRPGDPFILKGSCALDYRLVQVPDALRNGGTDSPEFEDKSYDTSTIIFWVIWIAVLLFILYSFLKSCLGEDRPNGYRRPPGAGPGAGYRRSWWSGDNDHDNHRGPPPPYSKTPQAPTGAFGEGAWRPGFWTGAALGGLANHEWEQRFNPFNRQPQASYRGSRNRYFDENDRGEGPSSGLGAMRSSTGLGGTNVR